MFEQVMDYFGEFPNTFNGFFALFFCFVLSLIGFTTLCSVMIEFFKRK